MNMNTEQIKLLVDKFMNGETTLSEEKALYAYFNSGSVADELSEWKDYFAGLGLLLADKEEAAIPQSASAKVVSLKPHRHIARWIAVAAAVVVAFIITFVSIDRSQNYCEAFVYGKKVTNKTVVMKEMKTTLKDIDADEQPTVDAQLKDVLM